MHHACQVIVCTVSGPDDSRLEENLLWDEWHVSNSTFRSVYDKTPCITIHRYPIFSTRYSVMCKVYTGYHGTSEIEHGMCACTADNPLSKVWDYLSVQAHKPCSISHLQSGCGRVVRWCWVSFQCQVVLLFWSRVGQGLLRLQ